jgi:hypothetical protein
VLADNNLTSFMRFFTYVSHEKLIKTIYIGACQARDRIVLLAVNEKSLREIWKCAIRHLLLANSVDTYMEVS